MIAVPETAGLVSGAPGHFPRAGLPVMLVRVAGTPSGRTEQPRHRGEHAAGVFINIDLETHPKTFGVTCNDVGATARHTREPGFNVTLARNDGIARTSPRPGKTDTTRDRDLLDGTGVRPC